MIAKAGMRKDKPGPADVDPEGDKVSPRAWRAGLCGCLAECSPEEFPAWLQHPEVDLVEWRIDMFAGRYSPEEMRFFLSALSLRPRLPVIATNRPLREMGAFSGREDLRLKMLEEAAKSVADWIDLEHDAGVDSMAAFREAGAKVLLSWHSPEGTPGRQILRAKLKDMSKKGADALKIATLARSDEDNLRVLELIPMARKQFGIDLVAFCMGPAGRWSRVVSIFLGSPWTYAQFAGRSATAPGQLSVPEMRELIRRIDGN